MIIVLLFYCFIVLLFIVLLDTLGAYYIFHLDLFYIICARNFINIELVHVLFPRNLCQYSIWKYDQYAIVYIVVMFPHFIHELNFIM